MLTNQGSRHLIREGAVRVLDELARYGGPWAAPLAVTGRGDVEVTDPASGLLRTHVVGGTENMDALWTATTADAGRRVRVIGIAATNDSPFLLTVPVAEPTPLRPHNSVQLYAGDTVRLLGPLNIKFS
jgi:hypothetical protein